MSNNNQEQVEVASGAVTERLLGVPEVAAWLGVSKDWVRAHASGRSLPRLPCVRVGRSIIRFREAELDDWARRMGIAAE
jgi:excisionase family DNA binding protein